MIRKEGMSFTASVVSTEWATIAEVAIRENIDRVVIGVYNAYAGSQQGDLHVRILAELVKGGEFVEVKYLTGNSVGGIIVGPVAKGTCLWGGLDDFGFESVRVQGKKVLSDNLPVIVEIKFLANEVGE